MYALCIKIGFFESEGITLEGMATGMFIIQACHVPFSALISAPDPLPIDSPRSSPHQMAPLGIALVVIGWMLHGLYGDMLEDATGAGLLSRTYRRFSTLTRKQIDDALTDIQNKEDVTVATDVNLEPQLSSSSAGGAPVMPSEDTGSQQAGTSSSNGGEASNDDPPKPDGAEIVWQRGSSGRRGSTSSSDC